MWRRVSRQRASPIKSLVLRLAELDQEAGLPTRAIFGGAPLECRRRRDSGECFRLSFGAACIAGGVAMLAVTLANSEDTDRSPLWSIAEARAANVPSSSTGSGHDLTVVAKQAIDRNEPVTIDALLLRDSEPDGRHLWWNVPTSSWGFSRRERPGRQRPPIARYRTGSLLGFARNLTFPRMS